MALAVAFVACQGAAGLPGEPGKAGPAGEPAKQAPYVALELPDLPGLVEGMSDTVDLSKAFGDPDGTAAALTLTATPTHPAIATASVSGTTLTVNGAGVGTTSVVVTATDADDLSVSQSVQVTVIAAPPPPEPPVTIDDVIANYPTLVITPTTAADASMEIELPADHTLISEDMTIVTVAKKAAAAPPASSIRWASATADDTMAKNVWVITAVSQGITDVDVLDTSKASVHTIRVTVTADPPAPMPDPVAPTYTQIPKKTLYEDESAQVDLAMYFQHANDSAITYASPSFSPTGIVTAAIAAGTLTLTPVVPGFTTVTVVATAEGLSVSGNITVEVKAGPKPPPPTPDMPEAPMADGTIPDQEVEVGESKTVDASMYFTPDTGLRFSVAPDGDEVEATVDTSGIVTIEGVKEGAVTITVTASNDAGSDDQEFGVTVEPAGPPHIDDLGDTLTIAGVGEEEDVEIDPGQSLRSLHPTKVSFTSSGQTWTIKALEKGEATIRVLDPDSTVATTFEVKINNTPPEVQDDAESEDITSVVLVAQTTPPSVDKNGDTYAAPTVDADGERQYYKVLIDFSDLFTDADGASDIKDYIAESLEEYVDVVEAVHSGLSTTWGVILDVELATGYSFPIEVYAVDDDGDKSDPVQIQIEALEPLSDSYRVTQNTADGSFAPAPLQVWRRKGTQNSLFFIDYTSGGSTGFNFVKVYEEDLIDNGLWFDFSETHASGVGTEVPSPVPLASAGGARYYTVTTGGAVDTATLTLDGDATGMFTLKGDGSTGTITYTLHVVVCTGAGGPPVTGCATGEELVVQEWRTVSKTLRLNIVDSSEDYDS